MQSLEKIQSKCTVHTPCIHKENTCDCIICWKHLAQCPYKNNGGSSKSSMGMARPSKLTIRIPKNNECERNINLYCTEEICDSVGWDEQGIGRNELGIKFQEERELYPQLFDGPGATPQIAFSFPADKDREKYIHRANEHFESVNKKYSDRIHTTSTEEKNSSIFDYFDMDSNSELERRPEEISGALSDTGNTGNNNESSIRNPSPIELPNNDRTMENERNNIDESRMPPKRTRTDSESSNSTNNTESSERGVGEPEQPTKKIKLGPTESTSKEETTSVDAKKGAYTFIVHKKYQRDDWKSNRSKGPTPNFITIDHGDHYHVIFECKGEGNTSRTRKRITEFLGLDIKGTTESLATFTKIKLLVNFILYCLRYGIRRINKYGSKIMQLTKQIEDLFENQQDEIDAVNLDAICKPYIEENREAREEKKRMGKTKLKTITDVITDLIDEHKISSYGQWETKISKDMKLYLLKEYGLSVESYIKLILRIKKAENTENVRNKTIIEILLEECTLTKENCIEAIPICNWIEYWMGENDIEIAEILAWTEIIRNKTFKKINGLVLQGPTNAGKSLFIRSLTNCIKPEQIPRENDNSQFKLDQLPTATAAIFEEPLITPNNVGTWKLLLEGATVTTDIKNKDKEPIPRIPIFITTECELDKHIDNREGQQVKQRIKIFKFKKGIKHLNDSTARTAEVERREINACPGQITDLHFLILYIKYWDYIKETQVNLLNTYIQDKENIIKYNTDLDNKIKCMKENLITLQN